MGNLDIFEQKASNIQELNKIYFITNRTNLLTILAAGMITTSLEAYRYESDSRDMAAGNIPLWTNTLPADFVCDGSSVVIEFEGALEGFLTQFDDISKAEGCIVTSQPVPIYFVSRYLFSSDEIKKDFVLRQFDDIPLDESLLGVIDDLPGKGDAIDLESLKVKQSPAVFQQIDKKLGALLALFKMHKSTTDSIKILQHLYCYGNGAEESGLGQLAKAVNIGITSDNSLAVDEWMLAATLKLLGNTTPDQGFDQKRFINEIDKASSAEPEKISDEVKKWCNYAHKILDREIDVHELSDKKSVIKRGILLFVLRPKLARIEKVSESILRPGPKVLMFGYYLAGFYSGALRMGAHYKHDYQWYVKAVKVFMESLGATKERVSCSQLSINYAQPDKSHMLASLSVNGFEFNNVLLEPNFVLARILAQAKTINYELDYDFENDELSYTSRLEGGRIQKVYIVSIKPNMKGDEVVRFFSPCRDLKGNRKARLRKQDLIDLLERNDDRDIYCRFAINSQREEVVVQVDQIVSNMDDGELRSHIEYVSRVADSYEADVSKVDKY